MWKSTIEPRYLGFKLFGSTSWPFENFASINTGSLKAHTLYITSDSYLIFNTRHYSVPVSISPWTTVTLETTLTNISLLSFIASSEDIPPLFSCLSIVSRAVWIPSGNPLWGRKKWNRITGRWITNIPAARYWKRLICWGQVGKTWGIALSTIPSSMPIIVFSACCL